MMNIRSQKLKTQSRIMVKSLRTLKMPLFLGFLINPFTIHFNDNSLEGELLEYIELNRNIFKIYKTQ